MDNLHAILGLSSGIKPTTLEEVMVQLASANGSTAMSETVNSKIRGFVVDDHLIIQRGLSMIVQDQIDMVLVGDASDDWEAVETISILKSDVALMDIELSGISGVEATKKISESNPNITLVILTSHEREDLLVAIRTVNAGGVCHQSFHGNQVGGGLY